jgi:hypothetical protein
MRNGSDLLEPEPRRKHPEEETTRILWKPPLPEFTEPRAIPQPKRAYHVSHLLALAPPPWPQGQFRIDPEA